MNDERHMRRAVELAGNNPALPFGAVIVDRRTGEVVAEGWNRGDSPLLHGEIDALNRLFETVRPPDAGELVRYTTAEPCPMCMGAILWAGVSRVVFGSSIGFLLAVGWKQIDISAEAVAAKWTGPACEVAGGVLATECDELFLAVGRAAPGR
jgi:tRNA(adenine34) deaminase